MPTLSLRTLCLCVKLSRLSPMSCSLSAVACELSFPRSPLLASLTSHTQLIENKSTLSPFPATLTSRVKPKSFVCRSYKKHGWGIGLRSNRPCPHDPPLLCETSVNSAPLRYLFSLLPTSVTHTNTRIPFPLMDLLHNSLDTPGEGYVPAISHRPPDSGNKGHRSLPHEPTHL
jgi:hypothetical protein